VNRELIWILVKDWIGIELDDVPTPAFLISSQLFVVIWIFNLFCCFHKKSLTFFTGIAKLLFLESSCCFHSNWLIVFTRIARRFLLELPSCSSWNHHVASISSFECTSLLSGYSSFPLFLHHNQISPNHPPTFTTLLASPLFYRMELYVFSVKQNTEKELFPLTISFIPCFSQQVSNMKYECRDFEAHSWKNT
jgi:hypothetical protein